MDPRIRARRAAVQRRAGRRRLKVLVTALAVTALAGCCWGVLQTPWFSAEHVQITGNVHTPRSEILRASGLSRHPALVTLGAAAMDHAIERLPWVGRATVRAVWPSGADVTIVERLPVAEVHATSGRLAEVDATGRVVAVSRAGLPPAAGLPVVEDGVTAVPPGSQLPAPVAPALTVAAALPASLAGRVGSIGVVAGGGVDLSVAGPSGAITVHLGAPSELAAKMRSLATLLARANLAGVTVIDVSDPAYPVTS